MSVLPCLSELIQECDLSLFDSCDYYVPVPLHRKRLQQRGFNQALWLTRLCFGKHNPRIAPAVLHRTINSVPQVTLNGRERRKSLRKAFICSTKIDISGATMCLVDDVYTTGTTVSECSRALLAGGAERVVVLTLARVDVPHRGRGRN
jgi:ComF family protein